MATPTSRRLGEPVLASNDAIEMLAVFPMFEPELVTATFAFRNAGERSAAAKRTERFRALCARAFVARDGRLRDS